MRRKILGFTLIELLVVVSIIMILAAIAVVNFMQAQLKAKTSRVRADMRTLETSLEAYFIDHQAYPPRHADLDPWDVPQDVMPPKTTIVEDLSRLTTPVSYLDKFIVDVFNQNTPHPYNLIEYWDDKQCKKPFVFEVYKGSYALMSCGPDGSPGVPEDLYEYGDYWPDDHPNTFRHIYDPTNGAQSIGNIWFFKKNDFPVEHIYKLPVSAEY